MQTNTTTPETIDNSSNRDIYETHEQPTRAGRFKYIVSDGFVIPNETNRDVLSVVFDIGRYGHLIKRIDFPSAVTESEAIGAVERWLSEPLSHQEFLDLKNEEDLFAHEDRELSEFNCRGDALGDCRFLEDIDRNGSQITLFCGS